MSYCTCQSPAMLLELAAEEAFPLGHLLVPGLQYSLLLPRVHGQSVRVGLVDVDPNSLQAVGVLELPTHHAHKQLIERIVVHEVAVPPHDVRHRTFFAIVMVVVGKQKLWLICRDSRKRMFGTNLATIRCIFPVRISPTILPSIAAL